MALNLFRKKSPEHLMAEAAAPERQLSALSPLSISPASVLARYWNRYFRARGNGGGRGTSTSNGVNLENAGAEFHSVVDNTCAPGVWPPGRRTGCYAFICGGSDSVRIRGALLRRTRRNDSGLGRRRAHRPAFRALAEFVMYKRQ